MSPHRHGNELRVGVQLGRERQDRHGIHVLAARHRQSHAEKQHAETSLLQFGRQILQLFDAHTGFCHQLRVHRLVLNQRAGRSGPRNPSTDESAEIRPRRWTSWFHVCRPRPRSGPCDPAAGTSPSANRVAREVPWMALRGIASPIHNRVGPIFHFAERATHLATQLGGHLRWAVSQ